MSCNKQNLRNLDTTIYRTAPSCCDNDGSTVTIQFFGESRADCQRTQECSSRRDDRRGECGCDENDCPCEHSQPCNCQMINTVNSYAYFFNASTTGVTYNANNTIPFPTALYNADSQGIMNNGAGGITLTGGRCGRTYVIRYQVSGTFTDTTVGLVVNGVNAIGSNSIQSGTEALGTVSGDYVVSVPANTTTSVTVNVLEGTVTTGTPTVGTNISVTRIA